MAVYLSQEEEAVQQRHHLIQRFVDLHFQLIQCDADKQLLQSVIDLLEKYMMHEFYYPDYQFIAGVDEVGRGPLVGASGDYGGR